MKKLKFTHYAITLVIGLVIGFVVTGLLFNIWTPPKGGHSHFVRITLPLTVTDYMKQLMSRPELEGCRLTPGCTVSGQESIVVTGIDRFGKDDATIPPETIPATGSCNLSQANPMPGHFWRITLCRSQVLKIATFLGQNTSLAGVSLVAGSEMGGVLSMVMAGIDASWNDVTTIPTMDVQVDPCPPNCDNY
jgi:hypothetical protein